MIVGRLVAHPGPFQLACRVAQYGWWASHIDAVLPNGDLLGARFFGGVQIRPYNYDHGNFLREEYIEFPADAEQTAAFYNFLHSQIGKPFDSLAILAFVSERDWRSPDKWFCSELFGAALVPANILPADVADSYSRFTPRDTHLASKMYKKWT